MTENDIQVKVPMPPPAVKKLEALAAKNNRTRANQAKVIFLPALEAEAAKNKDK